jgi:hypothetical protein
VDVGYRPNHVNLCHYIIIFALLFHSVLMSLDFFSVQRVWGPFKGIFKREYKSA